MNAEIQYLKKKNFLEKIAILLNKHRTLVLLGSIGLPLLILLIYFGIQYAIQKQADTYLFEAQNAVNQTLNDISSRQNLIQKQSEYFKEKKRYEQLLSAQKVHYEKKKEEVEDLRSEAAKVINQKFKNGYLETFKPDENTQKTLDEVQSVYDFQNKLIKDWETLAKQRTDMETKLKEDSLKNNTIQSNTTYGRVKQKSNQKLQSIGQAAQSFRQEYDISKPFQKSQIGTVHYKEILNLLKLLENVQKKQGTFLTRNKDFREYYQLLEEQYYTEVTDQSVSSNTAYETESNPAFREWTETESYQDTETYYETESYSGTCDETTYKTTTTIVDGKAVTREVPVTKSVPCTKTREVQKTRPVTRTRTVTKDNGEPRTIEVPYTTFSFYYTLKTVKTSGKTQSKEFSGSIKLQGTSPSQPSYTYESKENIGYIVWKEKWNDEIQEGYLKPYLK